MTRKELYEQRELWLNEHWKYKMIEWMHFPYAKILSKMMYVTRSGRGNHDKYNDVIIMADTETSKKHENKYDLQGNYIPQDNHVVVWTITLRAFNRNIVTLYGHKPSEMIKCMSLIHEHMAGDITIFFIHNLPYDWTFLELFMFEKWNVPEKQLNVKSHYPINIQFDSGIILRDSLILSQRSLEKWASDLQVEHQKAVGKWDYNKIRSQHQNEKYTKAELEYIEHDTLAGVECIQKTMDILNKKIYSLPYTATGIPREEVKKRGMENQWHSKFIEQAMTYQEQVKTEAAYHGGFTHSARDYANITITRYLFNAESDIECKDFASSYPYQLFKQYPIEKFSDLPSCKIDFILRNMEKYAFIFKLILVKPRLKDENFQMPMLQLSKCVKVINPILDNGRILECDYAEIYVNDIDAKLLDEYYDADEKMCVEVMSAKKGYLPKWFTDYVFECFEAKTKLKDIGDGNYDPVAYSMAKSKLNSLYGMICQRPCKITINEDYETGEYNESMENMEELYDKYLKKPNNVLNYQLGTFVTSYAMAALFELSKCCDHHLYSDTDSVYAIGWNKEKVDSYNQKCKDFMIERGYGCVHFNGREYWLGIAEDDVVYTEFRYLHSKCYCGRDAASNELKITVAGVPKKTGAKALKNNINNFKPGFIFSGSITGKKTHTYMHVDSIYIDSEGNETGNSIDLSECDYQLNAVDSMSFDEIESREIEMEVYE